ERQPQGLYSAVETGITFFSLPSFTFTFLPPSLARPGTSAGAGGGRLNVYDVIRSSVTHSRTFRARHGKGPLLGVCGLGKPVRLTLSSSYWPVKWSTAPTSKPCIHVSAGPSQNRLKLARLHGSEPVRVNPGGINSPAIPNS